MIRQLRIISICTLLLPATLICLGANGSPLTGRNMIFLVSGIIGGLGLFLMGIKMMSDSLTKSTGDKIRDLLARLTHNRLVAFFIGIVTTMVFQSSTATTVMLVSFVNSRIIHFRNTLGIIFGSAIGATVTIQLIAFRVSDYALTVVAVGFILYVISARQNIRAISVTIIGFGILFLGMNLMSDSIEPLKNAEGFTKLLRNLEYPATGIVVGALLTALIQSSSAFLGILIVLGSQGLISLTAAIPLMIGANIGTAITAIIAAAGSSREAKQVALAHTLFKLIGALIIVWFIPSFEELITRISTSGSISRQIANSHTIFNTVIAILFLPFTGLFAKFVNYLLPLREDKHKAPSTWYIDDDLLHSPALALSLARQEVLRMMEITQRMTEEIIVPFIERERAILAKIKDREKEINFLRDAINRYLVKIIRQNITEAQVQEAYGMMYAVDEFEQIADVISLNLIDKAEKWCDSNYNFSEEGKKEILDFHAKTMRLLYQAYSTFSKGNKREAVIGAKKSKASYSNFRKEFFDLEKQHYSRLTRDNENSVESSRTHMEIIGSLRVIGSHATNIARIILKERNHAGANREQLEGSTEGGV